MVESADVVVVGGGVIGASTAFHLAKSGVKRVTLVERGRIGSGATGKSHSLVRMHYTNRYDATLAQRSLPYFHHWNDLVGAGDPVFVKTGVLRLVGGADEAALRANVAMLAEVGVNNCVVGPDEIRDIDPGCAVEDVGIAAWEPNSGYADPLATAEGFALAAERHGATVQLGTSVIAISQEDGRVTGVETSEGTIKTERVVVATGAWGASLLAPLGINLGLVPKRVQIVVFRRPEVERRPQATIIDGVTTLVIRPEADVDTLVSIGFEPGEVDSNAFDESIDAEFIAECRRRLTLRRPAMRDTPMRGGWSGVVAVSPDGHIILDKAEGYDGLFFALGCSGTNFKTGPAIGASLAEWIIAGDSKPIGLDPFRASRFSHGQPIRGEHEYVALNNVDTWR